MAVERSATHHGYADARRRALPEHAATDRGSDAIRKFWFPSSSPTRVVAMELSIDGVHVDGDTAVTSGMGSLTFVVTTEGVDRDPRT
jgi:hypothetical protein